MGLRPFGIVVEPVRLGTREGQNGGLMTRAVRIIGAVGLYLTLAGQLAHADPLQPPTEAAEGTAVGMGPGFRPSPFLLPTLVGKDTDVFTTLNNYSMAVGWSGQGPVLEMSGTIFLDEGDNTSLMVDVDTYRLYGLVPSGLSARMGPKWVATPDKHWIAFSAAAGPFFVVDIYADQQMQGMGVDGKMRFEYGINRWPIVDAAYRLNKGVNGGAQVEFTEFEVALISSPAIEMAQWLLGLSLGYQGRRGSPWNADMWNEHGLIGTIDLNEW